MAKKKEGKAKSTEAQASAPAVEPVKEPEAPAAEAAEAKPQRTRVHRGQTCPIIRTTKNVLTGAIYDLILYTRNVTHRKSGEVTEAQVGKKLRRPGTGVDEPQLEIEITEKEV